MTLTPGTLIAQGEEHPDESVLLDFSAGRLGVAMADALVAHLDACSRCRQMLSSLTRSESGSEDTAVRTVEPPTKVGDVLVGQMLGEYRVLERMNQGGMGVLYRGEQPQIGKPVAIKVLLPEVAADPNLVHRLLGEARAVNSIRHPNIVDIFALGQLPDGRHYVVMELLEGKSLADLIEERGRLQSTEVHVVLEQVMGALQAAHAAGVIHRDMKPENIIVNPRSDGWRVTLLDFGLAKQQGSLNLTAPGMILGTPGYMAPEQIRGTELTGAIDIYAMGVVAWEMLTGRQPYAGGSIVQVMKRHLDAPVPLVRTLVPGIPLPLEGLVLRMMSKEPAARPTADEVRKILIRLKNDPRRNLQSGELTQLVSPEVPVTVPDGVEPVRAGSGTQPVVVRPDPAMLITRPAAGTQPVVVRPDPALLVTRPDRPAPRTLQETPAFVDPVGLRRAPMIMTAIGLALIAGAVGIVFFADRPAVAVEAPAGPSREEVERELAISREAATGLSQPATRDAVLLQLSRLEERLKKEEAPEAVARELEELMKDSGLR